MRKNACPTVSPTVNKPMVAQHQHRLVAQVLHQPLLLAHVQRHAFVVAVSDPTVELHWISDSPGNRPHFKAATAQPGLGVDVQHALGISHGHHESRCESQNRLGSPGMATAQRHGHQG